MGEPQSGHLQRGALGEVKLYGIRHHGPGSARSLLAALKAEPPELLLVEGPPEATPRPELFTNFEVELPIAVLHYVGANPAKIFHSPYSLFSPEWQAIGYAYEHGIPVSLIDLPLRHQLAMVNNITISKVNSRHVSGLLIGDVVPVPAGELKSDSLGNVVYLGGISIRYLSPPKVGKTIEK
ncbi:MAG: hypothetical protein EBV06_13305 [Planctomycetia bacterium]|nr:hypothetical protein [Planctomycetia bacterium]